MNELIEWLISNKIQHQVIDDEVIEIIGFGKMFYQDMSKMNSVVRENKDGELEFNACEIPEVLASEGIAHIVFKFGDNWYYTPTDGKFKLNILKYIGDKTPNHSQERIVNLGCHTAFELLNGSGLPKDWVRKAKWCGHDAIGICDRNTMAACYNLQKECDAAGVRPVFGYSLTCVCDSYKIGAKVYVLTNKGLRNLLRIQKAIMVDSEDATISFDELLMRGEGNVLVLDKYSSFWISDNVERINQLKDAFAEVFYQVDLTEYRAERIDVQVLNATKHYFHNVFEIIPVFPVLLCDSYYLDRDDYKNKLILNKIATGAAHEQSHEQYYKDVDDHYKLFVSLFDDETWDVAGVFGICCDNACYIADHAEARFENDRNFMPKYDMTEEEKQRYGTTHNMFCQLLEEGLQRLVPEPDRERYRKQMEYEKYIIESTNNVDYLLVQYDTCNYARRNNILVGCGRGSAAGSLLLYLLGITLIDPIKYDLIFERFLLPERAGLYPSDTTIIGQDIDSKEYVEVTLEHLSQPLRIAYDAQLYIERNGERMMIEAKDLAEGDDVLFDNRDELFTINEL